MNDGYNRDKINQLVDVILAEAVELFPDQAVRGASLGVVAGRILVAVISASSDPNAAFTTTVNYLREATTNLLRDDDAN